MDLLEGYRLFTAHYVMESDLPSEDKLQFIRFLKEANQDDIIEILSGQYEGIEALTETDVEAVREFLSEVGVGAYLRGARAAAGRAGTKVSQKMGISAAKRARAAEKLAKQKGMGEKGLAIMRKGKRAAYRRAALRTAAATGAIGGAGVAGYKVAK